MDRVADGGVIWRREITPSLNEMGVIVLDPCNKPYEGAVEGGQERTQRQEWKQAGEYDKFAATMKPIRTMDLRLTDVSDFIIVCLDMSVHACGTYEEITTANRAKKPILVWCVQGKKEAPDWLFAMIPHQHIFDTVTDLTSYLHHVNSDDEVETYRRWFFPIFSMFYDEKVIGGVLSHDVQ